MDSANAHKLTLIGLCWSISELYRIVKIRVVVLLICVEHLLSPVVVSALDSSNL